MIHPGVGPADTPARRRSPLESAFDVAVFFVFAVLWIAFTAALVWSQGSLDQAWAWFGDLPLIAQLVVGVLFLPVVAGLWVWESAWPLIVRLVLVGGLAAVNLYLFLPRAVLAGRS